jgi:hypothetical protein
MVSEVKCYKTSLQTGTARQANQGECQAPGQRICCDGDATAAGRSKLLLARMPVLTYSASLMIAGMLIAATFLLLGVVVFAILQKA